MRLLVICPRTAKLFFVVVLVLSALFISGSSYALMPPASECPAVLAGDLSLAVPAVYYNGYDFSVDFSVVPEQGEIEVTGVAPAMPPKNCKPSMLSQDLLLHIPAILFNGETYLADFEYTHGLSLALTGVGLRKNATLYQVLPASTFQQGCFPPCMCPVSIELPITGTFNLIEINRDRFRESRYSLDDINLVVMDTGGGVLHTITGFGVYRIGGDFALMQQLVLEISIDGGPTIRLDSGMQIPKYTFPGISIPLSTGTQCFNTLLEISAVPVD